MNSRAIPRSVTELTRNRQEICAEEPYDLASRHTDRDQAGFELVYIKCETPENSRLFSQSLERILKCFLERLDQREGRWIKRRCY